MGEPKLPASAIERHVAGQKLGGKIPNQVLWPADSPLAFIDVDEGPQPRAHSPQDLIHAGGGFLEVGGDLISTLPVDRRGAGGPGAPWGARARRTPPTAR